MSNNDIDLDIDNYSYNDLLHLFKIHNKFKVNENKNKIEKHLGKIKNLVSSDIYYFYIKAKNIILTIYQLVEDDVLDNLENETLVKFYIDKMKRVDNYEKMDIDELINIINEIPSQRKIYYNNISHDIQDDLGILDNPLNEKYLDTSSRINPSLNNRNNTNEIHSTFSNDVAPGYLNSIKRIIQTQNLNLNSCFRSNYYTSNPCDYLYLLPSEIKNVVSMRLASIEIPNAWYLYSRKKKNNFFKINIISHEKSEPEEFLIVIPEGNYNSATMTEYLNETYFYLSKEDTLLKHIKFSINEYSYKTTIDLTKDGPNYIYSYSLHFIEDINQNIMNTLGWTLGFRLATYVDITDKITSEGLFDGGGDRYIYVCINDYQYNDNNFNTVCFDKSILNEDVIAKIPMVNGKLFLIIDDSDNPLTKTRRYNGPVTISRLQIKILDKFGSIIDLNNMDFSFTLELEILYESFNFKNVSY
jgi:hypothetical protein